MLSLSQQHERNIEERDNKIRAIAKSFDIQGYESGPLDREKILRFISQLDDLKRKRDNELDAIKVRATSTPERNNIFKPGCCSVRG